MSFRQTLPLQIACVAICAFLVATPFASLLATEINAHDFSRVAQMAVMLISAFCGWKLVSSQQGTLLPECRLFVAAVLTLAATSTAMAPDQGQALRELCLVIGMAFVSICFAHASIAFTARYLLAVLVVGAASYSILLVGIAFVAAITHPENRLAATELFIGYDNYRFYNHVQTVSLLLLAAAVSAASTRKSVRWLAALGLACGFALLWLSIGRATTMAVAIASVAAVAVAGRHGWRLAKSTAIGACLGLLIWLVLMFGVVSQTAPNSSVPSPSQASQLTSDHSRFLLWGLAWDQIKSAPWFGIGPMHLASQVNIKAAHPHNIYLQIAAEWGVPMLILIVSAAAYGLWKLARRIRGCADVDQKMLGLGLWTTCLAIGIDGFFSGNFVMPISQGWIAAAIGLALAWHRSQANEPGLTRRVEPARVAPRISWGLLGFFVVLSQVWLIYEVAPEARNLQAHLTLVQNELAANPRTNPRFWSHGWFSP